VVKRDGRRESFDRTKLAMGLRRAIAKRPIDAEQINGLLSKTLRQIENEFDGEVPSRAIADAIMLRLKSVDGVAWLRYASFYEDFMGISRLVEELVNLGGEIKGDKNGG
jgi:transcriptional repressor NrdR